MTDTVRGLMITGLVLLLAATLASSPWAQRNSHTEAAEPGGEPVQVDMPVKGTFLRTLDWWPYSSPGTYEWDEDLELWRETSNLNHPETPAIVDLEANGFAANDKIRISYTAQVYNSGAWGGSVPTDLWVDGQAPLVAVFSTTADLDPIGEVHRVPGAIDFGEDFVTVTTHMDQNWSDIADKLAANGTVVDRGGETDIPEDFLVTPYTGMKLQIPEGAKYLFLCVSDSFYADNTGSLTVIIAMDVTGTVEDGFSHKLGGLEVTLLTQSPGGSTTVAVTLTDDEGGYSFTGIDDGDYQIEVALEYHKAVGDTAIFSVDHDTGGSVHAQTETFEVTDGIVGRDISFADADLIPAAGIPQDRLDDLAGMYYRMKQVVDFSQSELGVTLDLNLPIEVHGYSSSQPGRAYYDRNDGDIYVGANRSDYSIWTKPWTPDWHEMFHQLMDDAVGIPPLHAGDAGHGGYANHCTGDSWVEGWAEFWPCALARSLGVPGWYLFWGTTSLEQNWMVWDSSGGTSREEFAVASLLVDLVDPASPAERDFISMTNSQLWAIIGSRHLANMFEVYSALVAANIGQTDYDADGISDLDELSIAHGFFADDGNGAYDGETVGLGGKPGRQSTLLIPSAYIRILVVDTQGNPIDSGTLVVDVEFPSPLDIYNYSFEVSLHGSDDLVYFEIAPDRCDPLMKMRVRDGDGRLSDEFTLSNSEYREKVSQATEGYADEHTFVIGGQEKSESGGAPVWIWPIVGVAAVAAGVAGFLLFRRKAKPA